MQKCLIGLVGAVLCAGLAHAARVPMPDPRQGDGGVSAFYTWSGELSAAPGRMLQTEPLDAARGLPMAAVQFRILYSSTDGRDGRTPVAVSGAYFVPKGKPPAGGWPLVAWAHGTTGLADVCAPSWTPRSERDVRYLQAWLEQGYAIVATDYQGLGTPGPHPYLAVRPAAYSVLDSVRAVLKAFPDVANKIVVIGQSQGAHAAFATAGLAAEYAPELNIRGSVATGVPFLGPSVLRPPINPASPNKADPVFGYRFYHALVVQQGDPSVTAEQLFTERALPLLEKARTTCVEPLFQESVQAGLNRQNGLARGYFPAFAVVLPNMEYPAFHLPTPIFIGIGAEDRDAPPIGQRALIMVACFQGTVVEAHLYAGLDHNGAVLGSLKDSVPFVRKVMAGEPIKPVCEPVAE